MRLIAAALALFGAAAPALSLDKPPAGNVDLLIQHATVVDGSGAPGFRADVAIKGDEIVFVGNGPPEGMTAKRVIDAAGFVLSPGFIDSHAHGDPERGDFNSYIAMGVTTIALGQDGQGAYRRPEKGSSVRPERLLRDWISRLDGSGAQLNLVPFSGHATLRHLAGIPDTKTVTDDQQERMNDLLKAELEAGSFGLSTGLEYVPGRYSQIAELRSLGRQVAAADAIILSHLRSEDSGVIEDSVQELVDYGAGGRIQVSHLKIVYGKSADEAARLLTFLESKRLSGARLSADVYPYNAGYGSLGFLFPEWALPPADYKKVVRTRRPELLAYLRGRMSRRGGPGALLLGSPPFAGKTLAVAAAERGKKFEEVLLELGPSGGHGAHFVIDEAAQDVLVTSPITAISTDGAPGARHPRSTGTYAKLIEQYVIGQRRLTIEEAVRKSSGLPAALLGISDRGLIRVGNKADLLLFDPKAVKANSTYLDPFAISAGFDFVMINGVVVRDRGAVVPGRPGRVLRRGRSCGVGCASSRTAADIGS